MTRDLARYHGYIMGTVATPSLLPIPVPMLVRRNRDFCRGKPAAGVRRIAPQNLIDQSHHGKEETKGDKKREIKRARVSQSKHAFCRKSRMAKRIGLSLGRSCSSRQHFGTRQTVSLVDAEPRARNAEGIDTRRPEACRLGRQTASRHWMPERI